MSSRGSGPAGAAAPSPCFSFDRVSPRSKDGEGTSKVGRVLILLPPSETARPARGGRMRLEALSFPELTGLRDTIIDGLTEVSAHPEALRILEVPATLGPEVAANLTLRSRPAPSPGDLYGGSQRPTPPSPLLTTPQTKRRAGRRIVITPPPSMGRCARETGSRPIAPPCMRNCPALGGSRARGRPTSTRCWHQQPAVA